MSSLSARRAALAATWAVTLGLLTSVAGADDGAPQQLSFDEPTVVAAAAAM